MMSSRERDRPHVSFVVLSRNSARVIDRCVRSLVAQSPGGHGDEIWVVDNGSTDGSPDVLRALQSEFPDILNVLLLDKNYGTTVSRNLALRRVKGEYVAIVDSDVYAPAGTVHALIAHLGADDRTGLIAPRLIYSNGQLQLSADEFPTVMRKARRFVALKTMERRMNLMAPPTGIQPVDYVISAFWLMRRDVMNEIGPLDERIFYSPEDVDYCVRVWKAGYRVAYDTTVHAVHDAQEVSRGFPFRSMALSHMKGLIYLFVKHRFMLSRRRLCVRIGRFASQGLA
jgi:GT2 family glycosyltransferase